MKTKGIVLMAIMAFAGVQAPLRAQPQQAGEPLSLGDCIAYSLQHHPSVKAAGYDLDAAKQRAVEAASYYLPQVAGTGTLDDNIKRMTTVIPAGAFSPVDLKVQFGNQYTTNLYAQVDQVIYDQSLLTSISANKPNIELANLQRARNEEAVSYNTAVSYYNVVIQKERMRLLDENEKKLEELLRIQKLQLEKGVIQKVDVDRVQVNYNNTLSQKKAVQMSYDLALNQLKNAMGMELDEPLTINESLDYESMAVANVELETDIHNTWDYKIQEQNLRLQEIDLSRKRASVLPTLSAYARYGAQTFSNNFGDQYKNFYDYSVIGLRLNVPLFSSLKRYSQIKQSELGLYSARERFETTANNMELSVVNAYTALETTQSTLMVNKQNLDLAKSVFDNTNTQYQKGVASLSDLLNAEYAYKEAQNNYIASLLNYSINRLDLERSKGTLQQYIEQF